MWNVNVHIISFPHLYLLYCFAKNFIYSKLCFSLGLFPLSVFGSRLPVNNERLLNFFLNLLNPDLGW